MILRAVEIVEQYERQYLERGQDAPLEPLASLLDRLPGKAIRHRGLIYRARHLLPDGAYSIERVHLPPSAEYVDAVIGFRPLTFPRIDTRG